MADAQDLVNILLKALRDAGYSPDSGTGATVPRLPDPKNVEEAEKDVALIKEMIAAREKEVGLEKALVRAKMALNEARIKEGSLTEEEIKLLREKQEALKKDIGGIEATESAMQNLFGVTSRQTTMLSKMLGAMDKGSFSIKGMQLALSGLARQGAFAAAGIDKVVQSTSALIFELDNAAVSFARATGAGAETYTNSIYELDQALFQYGITAQDISRAQASLFTNVTDFTTLEEDVRDAGLAQVAILERMGAASDVLAKNIQIGMKVSGMSFEQSVAAQSRMVSFAQRLGISTGKMTSDFAAMAGDLASFDDMEAVFQDLQIAAKNTGLEMSSILQITDRFNKFDTSAEAVGRLNAALNTNFHSTQLLAKAGDPVAQLEILSRGIRNTGKTFQSLNFHQKRLISSILQINDMQLAMLMEGRIDDILPKPPSEEEIDQMNKFRTAMEELKIIFRSFAIDAVPFIKGIADGFEDLAAVMKYVAGPLVMAGGALAAFFGAPFLGTGAIILGGLVTAFGSMAHSIAVGNSPSVLQALSMLGDSMKFVMGIFSPFLTMLEPIVAYMSDWAHGATDVATAMDGIPESKSATFSATVERTSAAISAMPPATSTAISGMANATAPVVAAATAPAPSMASGKPERPIEISIILDGDVVAKAVHSRPLTRGTSNNEMLDSIEQTFQQGLITG